MGHLGPAWYVGPVEVEPGVAFHYTSGAALKAILRSGVLKTNRTMSGDRQPLTWASVNPYWEPASGRPLPNGRPMGFDLQAAVGGGHARLMVEEAAFPLRWPQLKRLLDPRFLALLTAENNQWFTANQDNWRGSTKAVGRDHWLAIERWQSPRWIEVPYSWEA